MSKFHISSDGTPGKCEATIKNCPRGGENEHYDSITDAKQAIEEKLEDDYPIYNAKKKENSDAYSAPANENYAETVNLPGDQDTKYHVMNIDGKPTALSYSGAIITDKEKTRQILESSIDQKGVYQGKNPYRSPHVVYGHEM